MWEFPPAGGIESHLGLEAFSVLAAQAQCKDGTLFPKVSV